MHNDSLIKRLLSGLLLGLICCYVIFKGKATFDIFVVLVAMTAQGEFCSMYYNALLRADGVSIKEGVISSFFRYYWHVILFIDAVGLIYLRNKTHGLLYILWLIITIAATDIAAYFTGRRYGGMRILPSISPGKTYIGLLGGIAAACLVGLLFAVYLKVNIFKIIAYQIVIALLAQTGDFIESYLKRRCDVKDSGCILPGHGGVLDRIDGFTLTVPAFIVMVNFIITN